MAAKLGDFFVNISTKTDNKGIKETATGLDDLIGKAKKLAATYLTVKLALDAVNADRAIIKDAAELGRLSDDLGIATEKLEQFGRAFEIVGAGADEAYSTIRGLTKLIPALQMGDENLAEAFGILGIGPQNIVNDQLQNFDTIRKRFSQLNSAQQLYFVNTIGLGEKSLRVLRLNDEEYQNLLETAKEAPLLNKEQKGKAESYAKMETRAGIAKDSLLRRAAIATAPTLETGAEKILNGAKFIDATFTDSNDSDKTDKIFGMFNKPKLDNFIGGAPKRAIEGISNFINDFVDENRKIIDDKTSMRREIDGQIPKSLANQNIVINNNFQNKTDIQVKEAADLQKDLTKHIPAIVDDVFGVSMKQASENFKSGVIQ